MSVAPVLEVDVGNTRLKWRLRNVAPKPCRGVLVRGDFASENGLLHELGLRLSTAAVNRILVGSVAADEMAAAISAWGQKKWGVRPEFALVSAVCAGIEVGYDDPSRLGVDRWLAVLAASRFNLDGVMVVDCGSAVTVDVLEGKRHLGGYIAPGLRLMHGALFKDTARVRVSEFAHTQGTPGRSTHAAVNGGVSLMLVGLVREVMTRLQHSGWWRQGFASKILLTGGDAPLLQSLLAEDAELMAADIEVVEDLVLDGLALAERQYWPWD